MIGHSRSLNGNCEKNCGFVYTPSTGMQALPKLSVEEAYVEAINAEGVIVGRPETLIDESRAVMWIKGVIVDLNAFVTHDPALKLLSAVDINDSGQIVGAGTYEGESIVYMLTPNP